MEFTLSCTMCGAEFTGKSKYALYCPECRIKKDKELRRGRYERYKASGKTRRDAAKYRSTEKGKACERRHSKKYKSEHREELKIKSREYYAAHREHACEVSRLYQAAKRHVRGAKIAHAKLTGKLTYCERMRLTYFPLPCGQREECRGCEHCPKGADCGAEERQKMFGMEWI